MRRFRVAGVYALVALGCGGQAGAELSRRSAEVPFEAPPAARGGEPDPAPPTPPPPAQATPPEEDVPPAFEDPGCPPVETPPPRSECDPFAGGTGCPLGQSCFPFVRYPSGPCEVEQYGTMCLPSGSGTQGDSCAQQGCAADHICISTGRGTQCARICSFAPGSADVCAPGLLCLPIDIEGFGGCL